MDEQELPLQDPPTTGMDLSDVLGDPPPQFAVTTTQPPVKPRNTGAPTSTLWDSVWGGVKKTAGSVTRGVTEGMNEVSNSVVGTAFAISKGTNAYKLGRTPEERAEWLKNYEKPTETQNPFQWNEQFVEGIAGPKQSGVYGVVSGITQFAVGMVGTSKYLKAMGVTAPAGKAAKVGFEALKGGVVDAAFFKGNADRLSDAVKGTFLENPVSQMLESDANDSELEGRLKNVAEGLVLGGTMDLIVGGIKAARAAKQGDLVMAAKILDDAEVAANTPKPTDVVTVREAADNTFEVAPLNGAESAKYATREEAETIGAALNYVNKTVNHGVSVDEWANAVEVDRWKAVKDAYDNGLDTRDAVQILDQTGLNIKYDTSPDEVINVVKALADTHLEPLEAARGRVETWEQTAEKAGQMAMDLGIADDPSRAIAQASVLFGDTDNLAARMYMLRTVRQKMADDVYKISRAADLNPDDGDLTLALEQGLNRLNALHSYLSGSTSNVARGLRQQAMEVGPLAGRTSDEVAQVAPEVAQRQKQATEALAAARKAKADAAAARKAATEAADEGLPEKSGKTSGSQLRDTDGLTAAEWSQYRAVKQALKALDLADRIPKELDETVEAMASMKRTADVLKNQQMPDGVTPDILDMAKARGQGAVNPVEELSKWMDSAEDALDAKLNPEPPKPKAPRDDMTTPVDQLLKDAPEQRDKFAWSQRNSSFPKGEPKGNPVDRLYNLLNAAENALEREVSPKAKAPKDPLTTPVDVLMGEKSLKGLTAAEIRSLARSIFMTDRDPVKMMRVLLGLENVKKAKEVIPQTNGERLRDFTLTWRMEAMLSSPTTHVGNVVSNAMVMMQRPVEYWWAGARAADKSLRDMAVDMVEPTALWHDVQDSMAAVATALKTGGNVLDPSSPDRLTGLVDLDSLRDASGTFAWGNALQALFRMPTRALMASDEFFKQMNYRMNVRAQILRQAREQGITDAAQLQQRLQEMTKWQFAPDGAAANPWALDYARVSTFTNDLGAGTIGQSIQELATKHPTFRIIMPFVKTPVNIFRFAAERTPVINRATAEWKAAMASGDPQRIALAKGKAEFGALFWAAGALLAYNKVITGGGPSDPALRKQLQAAGWQPYSIRIGDRYMSFRKGDPVFTAFSIVADAVEMSGELDDQELGKIATVSMAAVAASVSSKSFMQGVSDAFDAIASGREDKFQAFLENTAGSFIPGVLRRVDENPYLMESRGFVEELKARVPGFSATLEPKRNVFGEKIIRPPGLPGFDNSVNPFTISGKVEKPNVLNELVKLGKAMPMPEPIVRQGSNSFDLRDRDLFDDRTLPNGQNQSPYDRWLELIGETGLRAKLSEMVQSDDFKDLSEEDKLSWATGMVKDAHAQAKAQMLEEYPQVQQAMEMSMDMQGAVREVNAQEALSSVYEKYSKTFVRRKSRTNPAMPE